MIVVFRVLMVFGFCLVLPLTGFAQSAESYFNRGMQSFKNAQYQQALQHFQKARELGLDNKRLPYNLGVTYYKLGEYQQAYDVLSEAITDQDLAFYAYVNRALCAQKLQQNSKAIENLNLASGIAVSKQEQALAANLLQQFGVKPQAIKKRYHGTLMVGLGYNDNVTLVAIDDVDQPTTGADSYARYFAKLKVNPWEHIGVLTQLDGVKYQGLDDYDYNNLDLKLSFEKVFGAVELNLGGEFDKTYLDGDSIWQTTTAFMLVRYNLNPGAAMHASYKNSTFRNVSERYEYLQGDRRQAEFGTRLKIQKSLLKVNYLYETNDRKNLTEAGREADYSPTRHKISLQHQLAMIANTALEWNVGYRQSKYNSGNLLNGSLVLREDERSTAGLLLSYKLSKSTWFVASYHWLRNESNINTYTYETNNYLVSVVLQ